EIHPGTAPPTVYRALDFLTEEGLIHRIDAVNAWTACVDAAGAPHDLFVVCTECRQVVELHAPELSQQIAQCIALAGFGFAEQETELRALCSDCNLQITRVKKGFISHNKIKVFSLLGITLGKV